MGYGTWRETRYHFTFLHFKAGNLWYDEKCWTKIASLLWLFWIINHKKVKFAKNYFTSHKIIFWFHHMIQTKLVFLIIKTKFISISYLYETSMILNVFMEAKNTHAHTDTIVYTHKRVQTKITLTVELEGRLNKFTLLER